jgi:hypothetical protein
LANLHPYIIRRTFYYRVVSKHPKHDESVVPSSLKYFETPLTVPVGRWRMSPLSRNRSKVEVEFSFYSRRAEIEKKNKSVALLSHITIVIAAGGGRESEQIEVEKKTCTARCIRLRSEQLMERAAASWHLSFFSSTS